MGLKEELGSIAHGDLADAYVRARTRIDHKVADASTMAEDYPALATLQALIIAQARHDGADPQDLSMLTVGAGRAIMAIVEYADTSNLENMLPKQPEQKRTTNLKEALQGISDEASDGAVSDSYKKWHDGPQSPEVFDDLTVMARNYHGLMMAPEILERILREDGTPEDEIDKVTWGARLMIISLVTAAESADLPTID